MVGHSILTGLPVSTFNLLVPVPVSSGCITKRHTWSGLNNRHLSLTVLEAESPRSRCGQGCFSRGLSPWLVDGRLLPVSSVVFPLGVCVSQSLLIGIPVCREPPQEIPPLTRSCGRAMTSKADHGSRGLLNLLEHLPQNQNLSVLLFCNFHQLF